MEKETGQSTYEFAKSKLFEPIGIKESYWLQYHTGNVMGGAGLYLKPVDMARIGYLFLNHGEWKGNQIISKEWVKESTRTHLKSNMSGRDYGYLWWMNNHDGFSSSGSGGQTINVLPHQNMVVVTTGSTDLNLPIQLLDHFIIPSITSEPLEKDSIAGRALQEALRAESTPVVSQSVENPSFAKDISGKRYVFEDGSSYTFHFLDNNEGTLTVEYNGMKRTRSFGFNGNYRVYNDPSDITMIYSAITNAVATVTFDSDNNTINLQLKELQSFTNSFFTFTFDHDKVKFRFSNSNLGVSEEEGILAQ